MQHYVFNRASGKEADLSQEGEVAGFHAGDRVAYTEACFPELRGLNATVIGFSSGQTAEEGQEWLSSRTIWTQPDGGTALHSTPAHAARQALQKINS